jgi:predicted transcriptional regulator
MNATKTRTKTFGIRLDDKTFAKLQRIAGETDRTMGSVVRVLISLAEVGTTREIQLPSIDTDSRPIGEKVGER